MKKILAFTLLSALSISLFDSCKKGEDDPLISLRSRKARMAGEWTVSELESSNSFTSNTNDNGSSSASSSSFTNSFDGQNMTETGTWTFNGQSNPSEKKGTASIKYTFDKDGTYTSERTEDLKEETTQQDSFGSDKTTTITKNTTKTTGTWNFLHGVGDDVKNREIVSLIYASSEYTSSSTTTSVFTPTGGSAESPRTNTFTFTSTDADNSMDEAEVWKLIQLKNKEMVVESFYKDSNTFNESTTYSSGGSSTSSGTRSGEIKSNMTLIQ